ncbi:MAG: hypothetical protein J6R61_01060 [Bacteroidales bacterium]|nr:hypothetical protein [Bacteroidales bacterium]
MSGKIFDESSNVCQDQAKILLNYYQQAAEKIVAEEERIEKEIKKLEEEKAEIETEISKLWIWWLTIILFFVYFIKKSSFEKEIAALDERIEEFKKQHNEIFRDYKVSKMGVAYIPVAEQIKYEDKSFIVDYTNSVNNSNVVLQLSKRNDLLIDTIAKLEENSNEIPIVETSIDTEKIETDNYSSSIQEINQHDYLGGLERSLKTISYCMNDLDISSVSLPLVTEDSSHLNFLNEYATKDIPQEATIVNVFDKQKYADSIDKFQELNKLKDSLSTKTHQFEDVLKSLMKTMASSVQTISSLKLASVDKMVVDSNKLLLKILKSPYNHYSPTLEYDEIEKIKNEKFDYSEDVQNYEPFNLKQSSRVKLNLISGEWTSEDGDTTNMPFGVHQIYEEIVSPVVQNLLEETRLERLKVYNHIKDQKLDYLNKWHQDTDAFYRSNRAEGSDIINLMQESLREYIASYNTLISLQRTENSMKKSGGKLDSTIVDTVDNTNETLAAFELQSQEFQKVQEEFEKYIERLKDDINFKAEKFGHVEYYDGKLRDGYSNEVAVAASEVHSLDDRRKPLAAANPLFAKTSNLPPQPNIEDITFEHISLNLPSIAKNALDNLEQQSEYNPTDENIDEEEINNEDIAIEQEEINIDENQELENENIKDEYVEEDEELEDEEIDEEDLEDEEIDEEDLEDEEIDEEVIRNLSDEELMAILDELEVVYDKEDFDRDAAIEFLLSSNNE